MAGRQPAQQSWADPLAHPVRHKQGQEALPHGIAR